MLLVLKNDKYKPFFAQFFLQYRETHVSPPTMVLKFSLQSVNGGKHIQK